MSNPPAPEAPRDRVTATVGGYELLTRIGEGGMGVVHLARRPGGDRVALKVLRPHIVGDEEARARLAREVSSLARISSRWVAEIVDADPWGPVPYVATRYVPGLSLHDHVHEEGPVEGPDLLWFAACLAEGVASVHAAGVLHRDVKPSNVIMEGRTPILIDFGLARVADDPRLTHTGWLLGTPGYLAPEILYGDDATAASDVHSWAATVAYAGLARPPFGRGPSMAIMDRVRRGEHDLTGLPPGLGGLVAAALHPEPAQRPDLAAILGWLRPQVAPGTRPAPVPPPAPPEQETLPLAADPQAPALRPTDVLPTGTPAPPDARPAPPAGPPPAPPRGTRLYPDEATLVDPGPPGREDPPGRPHDTGLERELDPAELAPPPVPARPPLGERLRRGVLLAAAALLVGAALTAFPWPTTVLSCVVVWLLRSGSLAATAVGERRRLRGRRWYDGPQVIFRAPWELLRSLPATICLLLWAAGIAVAAALLCYAFAASQETTLLVSGIAWAVALWTGPGGSRLRSPLGRVVTPVARGWQAWLAAVVVLVGLAAALGLLVARDGVDWAPGQQRPLSGTVLGTDPR
ncbi:serine/threonine-protein kinase [Nocardioides sp. SYSU D00038]|uniref:serine/threonine-protein kinase n=1 Tax=Nocardioides sp. SYSU D00038 TaxID=2812554 RepID=UPI0019689C5A|nr:serine/threonine-protein kinase [Nocardioides sp. SYSU D00038]